MLENADDVETPKCVSNPSRQKELCIFTGELCHCLHWDIIGHWCAAGLPFGDLPARTAMFLESHKVMSYWSQLAPSFMAPSFLALGHMLILFMFAYHAGTFIYVLSWICVPKLHDRLAAQPLAFAPSWLKTCQNPYQPFLQCTISKHLNCKKAS